MAAAGGVGYQTLAPNQPAVQVLGDVMRDTVLFAAVLLLGEAVRTRRALQQEEERSERLLLNVLTAPIATRLKQHEGPDRRWIPRGHGAVRRHGGLHPALP